MKYIFTSLFFLLIATYASAEVDMPFGVKMVSLDNGETRHVKYNINTGEAWWSKNTQWIKIKDKTRVPTSVYEFVIVSTGKSWRVLRIDKTTGDVWKKNLEHNWVKIIE